MDRMSDGLCHMRARQGWKAVWRSPKGLGFYEKKQRLNCKCPRDPDYEPPEPDPRDDIV